MKIFKSLLFIILFTCFSSILLGDIVETNSDYINKNLVEAKEHYLIIKDSNETEIEKFIVNTKENYTNILNYIEDRPFSVDLSSVDKYQKRLIFISNRIKINDEKNHIEAVKRDLVEQDTLIIKTMFVSFLYNYEESIKKFETISKRIKDVEKEIEILKEIKKSKTFFVDKTKELTSFEKKKLENINDLNMNYHIYLSFLDNTIYQLENKSTLFENIFSIDKLRDEINKNLFFTNINSFLRSFKLDIGGIIILISTMFLFMILTLIINRIIIPFIISRIKNINKNEISIFLEKSYLITRPITLIMFIFSIEISISIVFKNEATSIFFSILYILLFTYLGIIIVNIISLILLSSENLRNKLKTRSEIINLLIQTSKGIIFIIGSLFILHKLGVNIVTLIASLGIGGFAIALAAKDTIANFFGSLKIIIDNSFSQGNWVALENGEEGTVIELGFISTKIRTFDNAVITIPNSNLSNGSVKNWNKRVVGRRIKMTIGVTYNSKREDVLKAIKEINQMLSEHEGISTQKRTNLSKYKQNKIGSVNDIHGIKNTLLVYLDSFGDSSINILIYAFTNTVDWNEWLRVKQDVLIKIWVIIENNNLEFAFPTQTVILKEEEGK